MAIRIEKCIPYPVYAYEIYGIGLASYRVTPLDNERRKQIQCWCENNLGPEHVWRITGWSIQTKTLETAELIAIAWE